MYVCMLVNIILYVCMYVCMYVCTGLVCGGQAVLLHEESDVLHVVLVQHAAELDHLHT